MTCLHIVRYVQPLQKEFPCGLYHYCLWNFNALFEAGKTFRGKVGPCVYFTWLQNTHRATRPLSAFLFHGKREKTENTTEKLVGQNIEREITY